MVILMSRRLGYLSVRNVVLLVSKQVVRSEKYLLTPGLVYFVTFGSNLVVMLLTEECQHVYRRHQLKPGPARYTA